MVLRWEIRIVVAIRRMRNMIALTDVLSFRIVFAVARVIAQWFHANFFALSNHDVVVIAALCERPDALKLVQTCVVTTFATQYAAERQVSFVRWRFHAHDFLVLGHGVPFMAASSGTQGSLLTTVRPSESAVRAWKLRVNFRPAAWEIADGAPMGRMRQVAVVPDVD